MPNADNAARATLEALYERFNAHDVDEILALLTSDVDWPNIWEETYVRGHEEVRDFLTGQWADIEGTDTPKDFSIRPDGRIDVTVHQVVSTLAGELLSDSTVHHIYRLRDGQVAHMEIRRPEAEPPPAALRAEQGLRCRAAQGVP